MKKIYIIFISLLVLVLSLVIYNHRPKKIDEKIEETICMHDCKVGDKIVLKDNSAWHVISNTEGKLTLLSDANIDLEGNYLSVDYDSNRNTGNPVAFDLKDIRAKEKNPYCICPDLGCSAYEKNNIDVFEDSYIKGIIDNKYTPKIKEVLNLENITVRLIRASEFISLKEIENNYQKSFPWLYHSGYWTMDSYNQYSLYVLKEKTDKLSVLSAYIPYQVGIRPVIEINSELINNKIN